MSTGLVYHNFITQAPKVLKHMGNSDLISGLAKSVVKLLFRY